MKKRTAITIISILSVIAVGATVFGINKKQAADRDERYISANYQHAFTELVSGISDMDTALQKSLLVTSPSMAGAVCTEVYGKAQIAKMALGVLPFTTAELEKTSAFIGKVGDYAYSLSRKSAKGESFSQEEKDNLRSLSETASLLAQNFKAIQNDLGSGLISVDQYARSIDNLDKSEGEIIPQTLGDNMSAVEQEFPELPALIYDGPFSEHLKTIKPRMLEGKPEIDTSEGRKAAAQFIGVRPEQVHPSGEMNGDLPSLIFETKIKNSPISIYVSKQGGMVYEVIGSRQVDHSELSAKEAIEAAKKFMERRGFTNMRESYYLISNNVLTANFAYVQDGVVCYSDLVKVGISLDDGSLQSYESSGYITSHYQREIPAAAVSVEQAKNKVPPDIKILGTALTLIPDEGKNEILCHEFECEDANGQKYLIYVNAATGGQEKIFILLQDENGTLTV